MDQFSRHCSFIKQMHPDMDFSFLTDLSHIDDEEADQDILEGDDECLYLDIHGNFGFENEYFSLIIATYLQNIMSVSGTLEHYAVEDVRAWINTLLERTEAYEIGDVIYACSLIYRLDQSMSIASLIRTRGITLKTIVYGALMLGFSMLHDIAYSVKAWDVIFQENAYSDAIRIQKLYLDVLDWNILIDAATFKYISDCLYAIHGRMQLAPSQSFV